MRRSFDYDDDEQPWEADEYDGDMEYDEAQANSSMMDMMQLELEVRHINNTVLGTAIRLLEKSWLWNFRTTKTRLRLVKEVYGSLVQLVQPHDSTPPQDESNNGTTPI